MQKAMKMSKIPSATTSQMAGSNSPAKSPIEKTPAINAISLQVRCILLTSKTFYTALYEQTKKVLLIL